MNSSVTSPILDKLSVAIENNEIQMPAMPDMSIKIQKMLDDMNVSAHHIVQEIAKDPVLVTQIIKSANSAQYAGKARIETVSAAVSRIGYKMLRNIIMTITMRKLSNTTHPIVKKHIADFWAHSREVAAISYVLAKTQKHLNADQAMMAWLVHDIGTLPLCLFVEKMVSTLDETILSLLARKFKTKIGNKLLAEWQFPSEITDVILAHENLQHETGSAVSNYTDIVTIANILNKSSSKLIKWEDISATKRLYLSVETFQSFFELFETDLNAAREMLT